MATTTILEVVEALGLQIVSDNGKNAKGYCPVHKERTGHEDSHPSWSINIHTGAWRCFSCHGVGALGHLVEAMGGHYDGIGDLIIEVSAERARKIVADDEAEEEKPITYVSERLYAKNPYPHKAALERRDLDIETAKLLNIRWSKEGLCYLLPMYSFDGVLMGWQEKSAGYFNNYPPELPKSRSLFGYQGIRKTKSIVLVESQLDAARFWRYSHESVAQMGSSLSDEQAHALERLEPDEVVIAMDYDNAGDGAAAAAATKLRALGVNLRYYNYEDVGAKRGDDPGDLEPDVLLEGLRLSTPWAPPEIAERLQVKKWYNRR